VYAELLARAEALLERGFGAAGRIWSTRAQRDRAAELAERTASDLVALQCTLPAAAAARWLAEHSDAVTDADQQVAESMAADADPWPDAYELSTYAPQDQIVARAIAVLGYPED
jgi:predicted kinase